MGINSLYLFRRSSRPPLIKRLSAHFPITPIIRNNNNNNSSQVRKQSSSGHGGMYKAPSTADEFERLAEEKERQGIASQTSEKAEDDAQEAALEEFRVEDSVKEKYEEPVGKGNFHMTGENHE